MDPEEAPQSNEPLDETTPPPPVEVTAEPSWYNAPWAGKTARVISGLVILTIVWCMYVSRMPLVFDVNERAVQRALERGHIESEDQPLVTGYTTVSTTLELTDWLLKKPGGFLHNDRIMPNAYLIDNMPNFELGVVNELRDTVEAFRMIFSRPRAQSIELPYLIDAHRFYSFQPDSWMIPPSEAQYRTGRRHVETYLEAIVAGGEGSGLFVSRQDALERYLKTRADRLGSFSVLLRAASPDGYAFNPKVETQNLATTFDPIHPEYQGNILRDVTPWHKRDDIFYEVRGSVYVMYHVMLALRTDFEGELNDKRAMGQMNRILSELHAASQPLVCPVVLNGSEFGFFHNHSLTAAAHIAKAHVAVNDLRVLLRGGSDG